MARKMGLGEGLSLWLAEEEGRYARAGIADILRRVLVEEGLDTIVDLLGRVEDAGDEFPDLALAGAWEVVLGVSEGVG